jgi:hypothetical protein
MSTEPVQPSVFWGELAPCEHIAQVYSTDQVLVDGLTTFVSEGLKRGESTVVIATPDHLRSLWQNLVDCKIDVMRAMAQDRYIALDASVALSTFMVGDWPDDERFAALVDGLLRRASAGNRKVRAFGEMVALLWAKGHWEATVHLERLWHQLCQKRSFCLFCAYPRPGFTKAPSESVAEICAAHTRVI